MAFNASIFDFEVSWYHYALPAFLTYVAFKFLFLRRSNLPPSPGSFPIVGSFPLLGAKDGEPAHQMFGRLSEKFGPIVYLKMGANPTIIVSNSDIAKIVLKDLDSVFASRPYLSAGKYMGMEFQSLVFAHSGPYYRRLNKIYTTALLSPKRVVADHEARENGVFEMLGSIYKDHMQGEPTNLSATLKDLSLNNLISMIFGRKDGKMVKNVGLVDMEELKSTVRQSVELAGEFNVGDFITIARWLDLQGVIKRMKKLRDRMKAIAKELLDDYQRDTQTKRLAAGKTTIVDVLLSLEGEDKLSVEAMSGVMFDMIIAGSDTTSVSSDWTIAELLRQPQLLLKLQKELDIVVGKDRFVLESDIPKLPYLQAVIKESLRLHPPAPLGIPHCSTEACEVAGYTIPVGTTALINIWAINRDPKHWENPLQFWPERFENLDIGVFGSAYHLLPFSSGRRGCSGMLLGLTMVQIIVANLVHTFDFHVTTDSGFTNASINVLHETPGLVSTRAYDLVVHVTPRLPSHVFC